METTRLIEMSTPGLSENQIDRDSGVVKNLVVQTKHSKNGKFRKREYSDKAMIKIAEMLNANPRCYLNHSLDAKKNRTVPGVLSLTGRWSNAKFNESTGKTTADLKLIGTADEKERVLSRIIEAHDLLGISVVADGRVHDDYANKKEIVTEASVVMSADLVTEPGATTNLFESNEDGVQAEEKQKKGTKKMTLAEMREAHPDLVEQIESAARTDVAKENAELKSKLEEAEKKLADLEADKIKAEHKAAITGKLVEAGLDSEKHFKFIESLDEKAIDEYIAEWKTVKSDTKPKPGIKKNFTEADNSKSDGMAFIESMYGGK